MRALALAAAVALATVAPAARPETVPAREPETTRDALAERWGEAESRILKVDGARIHYVLEGSGEPVVLLNASFMG
ncbi:MAG: alpha/beta hydrolase, partial [Alphaproteobacteria bacterium]|nr:alpha/beta hydrolase [Alphaproteobacteria bacterium]